MEIILIHTAEISYKDSKIKYKYNAFYKKCLSLRHTYQTLAIDGAINYYCHHSFTLQEKVFFIRLDI